MPALQGRDVSTQKEKRTAASLRRHLDRSRADGLWTPLGRVCRTAHRGSGLPGEESACGGSAGCGLAELGIRRVGAGSGEVPVLATVTEWQ